MDDSAVAALRETFTSANSAAEWATLAVVIGLIVEFAVLLVFAKEISRTEKWLLVFANILVAGGVGGEYVFGGRATNAAVQLQQVSDEKVAGLTKDTARLSSEAATARASIAAANVQAAEASRKAAEAELALEKVIALRRLSPDQQAAVIAALSKVPNIRFDMAVVPGDPEALFLLMRLSAILEESSWQWIEFNHPTGPIMTVGGLRDKPNFGYVTRGNVSVEMDPDHVNEFLDAAKALSEALNTAGIPASTQTITSGDIPNHDTLHVLIGKKYP